MPTTATVVAACGTFGVIFSLSRRPVTSLILSAYLFAIILATSAVKQAYLNTPLTFADVQFFFLEPIENLKLFFNYPMLAASIVALLLVAAGIVVAGVRIEPLRWPFAPLRPRHALLVSGIGGSAIVVVVGMLAVTHASHPGRADEGDAYAAFLALRHMEQADGALERLNVFFENRDMLATLPPLRVQHRFPTAAVHYSGAPAMQSHRRPDILIVLEESTFDPTLIAKCRFPACDSPLFHAPTGLLRTQQGPLAVHTTGGGTWLSEFAFLSGFDWRVFGRGGAYAPVSLAPRLTTSLPMYLRSLDYRTVVISAVDANFLRARSGYRDYGFDEFYAAQDLRLSPDWYSVHDSLVFTKALALIDRRADTRPVFAYILTIRNHGPHGDRDAATPASLRPVEQGLGRPLADYLGRLDDSTHDYADLRQKWLTSARPRVVGWFGDHQPEFVKSLIDTIADVNRTRLTRNAAADHLAYLTYYQLSANFGGPQVTTSSDALDISFLGEELLSFAGLPLDPGSVAARDVASACRGLLFDCADSELVNNYFAYRIHDLRTIR